MLKNPVTFLPLIAFLVLAGIFAVPLLQKKDARLIPSVLIDRPMPATGFAAVDMGGQPALVNFFASWCVTCAAEQETLSLLAKDEKITIFGIAYKDKPEAVEKWLKKHGDPFKKVVMDPDGRVGIDWGVSGVPETFLVDLEGIVRYRHVGVVTMEVYAQDIKPVLEEIRK